MYRSGKNIGFFNRSVGCKGTSVDMYPTKEGLEVYMHDSNTDEEFEYTTTISWQELEDMLRYAKKKKLMKAK